MVAPYFLGTRVLKFFGVSLPAVQVGGGLVVCALGWALLMQKDGERNATPDAIQTQNIFQRAFYPLTLPLTVGPGSISVAITVGANTTHNYGVHVPIMLLWLGKQEPQLNGSTESGSGQGQYLSWKKLRQIWLNKNLRGSRLVPSVTFGQQSYCAISFSSAQFWFMGSDGWPRHIEMSLFCPSAIHFR